MNVIIIIISSIIIYYSSSEWRQRPQQRKETAPKARLQRQRAKSAEGAIVARGLAAKPIAL